MANLTPEPDKKKTSGKTKKIMLTSIGILMLIFGIIGIVLPVLPTTPFLLLAAFLFFKNSKRLHSWLINNKVLGEYIYNYQTYHAIKRNTKISAIILLWVSLGVSFYFVNIIYVRIFLIIVGIAVSVHLLMMKTLENVIQEQAKKDEN